MPRPKSATKETAAAYGPAADGVAADRVGVRELRDHLSRHLERVKAGMTVTVTEHGRAVARIVPIADPTIEDLIAAGLITPPSQPKGEIDLALEDRPVAVGWSLSDYIIEQRREAHADLLRSIGVDEDPAERA